MKNTLITLFIADQTTFQLLMQILSVLDGLDIDNQYAFPTKDLNFSLSAGTWSNAIHLHIPLDVYSKFMYRYTQLNK